ncbi:hypothetical protein J437_LFUL008454 [Ladona fulva]|uniref:DDE Tnp4 domain-containing protein n=1 Tax=Ladona fulva TaxID=123851 RepID=A0A8K0P2F9_LADFU|nr:hypothetical protein J437_LFUL008454 [Ladona fulva]
MDGKHIWIKCPPKSGSEYFNYKSYFSTVLMACADADSLFIIVSVGDVGRNTDSCVLKYSSFFEALHSAGNCSAPVAVPKGASGSGSGSSGSLGKEYEPLSSPLSGDGHHRVSPASPNTPTKNSGQQNIESI